MLNNYTVTTNKELNNALYSNLEKQGVLDQIKSQIRTKLIQNLSQSKEAMFSQLPLLKSKINDLDIQVVKVFKASVTLIREFLSVYSLTHTLSVFLVENGFKDVDYLSDIELLDMLKFSRSSLSNDPHLVSLINYELEKGKLSKTESFTQTNTIGNSASLDDKLAEIDKKHFSSSAFKSNFENAISSRAFEEKIVKYQKEYDLKQKAEFDKEVQRIRQIEAVNVRLEENKKYQSKLEEMRGEYEANYRQQLEQIKKMEQEMTNRLNLREKEIEGKEYLNRQELQGQLERLRGKEEDLQKKYDTMMNQLKLEEEKLIFKQREVDYIKDSSSRKLKEEIEQFKQEYEHARESERSEIANKRMQLEEREFKLNLFKERLQKLEVENESLEKKTSESSKKLKESEGLLQDIRRDNENLRNQLKTVINSEQRAGDINKAKDLEIQHYKDEISTLKNSLDTQKRFLEERKSEYGSLIESLRKQLSENDVRNEKIKEDYNLEYDRLKRYYSNNLEREQSQMKEKNSELSNVVELLTENLKKYKSLYSKMSKKLIDIELGAENSVVANVQNTHTQAFYQSVSSNTPYLSQFKTHVETSSVFSDLKSKDHMARIRLLEKEYEANRVSLKETFSSTKPIYDKSAYYQPNKMFESQVERMYPNNYFEYNQHIEKEDMLANTAKNFRRNYIENDNYVSSISPDINSVDIRNNSFSNKIVIKNSNNDTPDTNTIEDEGIGKAANHHMIHNKPHKENFNNENTNTNHKPPVSSMIPKYYQTVSSDDNNSVKKPDIKESHIELSSNLKIPPKFLNETSSNKIPTSKGSRDVYTDSHYPESKKSEQGSVKENHNSQNIQVENQSVNSLYTFQHHNKHQSIEDSSNNLAKSLGHDSAVQEVKKTNYGRINSDEEKQVEINEQETIKSLINHNQNLETEIGNSNSGNFFNNFGYDFLSIGKKANENQQAKDSESNDSKVEQKQQNPLNASASESDQKQFKNSGKEENKPGNQIEISIASVDSINDWNQSNRKELIRPTTDMYSHISKDEYLLSNRTNDFVSVNKNKDRESTPSDLINKLSRQEDRTNDKESKKDSKLNKTKTELNETVSEESEIPIENLSPGVTNRETATPNKNKSNLKVSNESVEKSQYNYYFDSAKDEDSKLYSKLNNKKTDQTINTNLNASQRSAHNKFTNVNYEFIDKTVSHEEIHTEKNEDDESENYGDFENFEDNDKRDYKDSIDIDVLKSGSYNLTKNKESVVGSSSVDYKFDKLLQSKTQDEIIEENIDVENSKSKSDIIEEDSGVRNPLTNHSKSNYDKYDYSNNFDKSKSLGGGKKTTKNKGPSAANLSSSGNNYFFESKNSRTSEIKSEIVIQDDDPEEEIYEAVSYDY